MTTWAEETTGLRRQLGDQLRLCIDLLLTRQPSSEQLAQALEKLRETAEALDGPPAPAYNASPSYWGGDEKAWGSYLDMTMFGGGINPLGVPMSDLAYGHDEWDRPFAEGTVRLGRAYLGGPNMVHGGYVAGLLDHMFGLAMHAGPLVAVTGTLTIRYLAPTPVERDLHLHAWFERAEGRRLVGRATIHDGDTCTAEAEGLFVAVDMLEMAERTGGFPPEPGA